MYFCDHNHPLAHGNSGFVYMHRHVASIKLGRWVTSKEVVHHIDGDKTNNSQENLEVLSRADHSLRHSGGNTCIVCGSPIHNKKKTCSDNCSILFRRRSWPSKEWLARAVWKTSKVEIGEYLGCSGRNITKMCVSLNIQCPKLGYWNNHDKMPL